VGRPRLKDVAAAAGVSASTVSRVVNDVDGVSEGTRDRVHAALRELDYTGVGVRHSPEGTRLVGLVVPELTNPIFPLFAQAVESRLAGHGFTTILGTASPGGIPEPDYVAAILDRGISGLAVISGNHADPTADQDHYATVRELGISLVTVNGMPDDVATGGISIDHRHATGQAVTHLASLGHRAIALAAGPAHVLPTREHLDGFTTSMAFHDLDSQAVAHSAFGLEGGHAAGISLLDAGATAIVCGSDLMALGVIRAAHERGLDVPGDVSVVGFDDAGPWAFTDPPLTSTRQPVAAMADAVMRLLLDDHRRAERLWFRGELVVRGSTGPAPTRAVPAVTR